MKTAQAPEPIGSDKLKWSLLSLQLIGFLSALAVGVDGHAIFQILALEELGLGPRAIGIALGLGTLSIPIQIWAARIPLHRARHNARLYLLAAGLMALATAALITWAEPGSWVAGLALVIAILAEISVSVLLATSWQPLISYCLTSGQRAFMLGPAGAVNGFVILGSTLLFGELNRTGRIGFLIAIALTAFAVSRFLAVLPPPPDEGEVDQASNAATGIEPEAVGHQSTAVDYDGRAGIHSLYLLIPALGLVQWPLLVTYAAFVLWPEGSLGLIGAALAAGPIVASLLWRDPGRHVVTVVKAGATVLAACTVAVVAIDGPITSGRAGVWLLTLIVVGTCARRFAGIGITELSHRRVDNSNSVRVMTMMDVIGSTSHQAGLFVAGFLIAASAVGRTPLEPVTGLDPYQLWILATALLMMAASLRLRLRPGDIEAVS